MKLLFIVLALVASLAFSFPLQKRDNDPSCLGFRITSPTQPGLVWTEGILCVSFSIFDILTFIILNPLMLQGNATKFHSILVQAKLTQ